MPDLKIKYPLIGKYPLTFKYGEAPKWYLDIFGYPHNGIDIGCPVGTPVVSTDDGVVIFADDIPDQNGCGVILLHAWGTSLYWHLSKVSAKLGDEVKKGDTIGYSGVTGYVTGPHLHFGIKVSDDQPEGMRGWTNPEKYLEGEGQPEAPATPEPRKYTVVPGDSLWLIAEKFYQNGLEWTRIYKANKDKIENPNIIQLGQELEIP